MTSEVRSNRMSGSLLGEGGRDRKERQQHVQRLWGGRGPVYAFADLENRAEVAAVQRGAREGTRGPRLSKVLGLDVKSIGKPPVFQTTRCPNQVCILVWTTPTTVS